MESAANMNQWGWWKGAGMVLLLGTAVFGVYGGTGKHGWVAWDDNGYITENEVVRKGLTWAGTKWAWTTGEQANWHPLTWLSLMVDREVFGDWAGGGHLESAALHWVNALLLWWVLGRLTGRRQAAWWAALLWAVHPLRAESVAWASERKDVLSALFGLAAVGVYLGGHRDDAPTRRQGEGRGTRRMWKVAGWMAVSLLCKPTLVTLPCLLLLLDGWPLKRWGQEGWWRLVREKWMLWGLAAAACAATLAAQREAMASMETVGWGERAATALTAYGWYLEKWVWPSELAFYYPRSWAGVTWTCATGWGMGLAAATALAVWAWRRHGWGWAGVGWFWFLGTFVPMIGLVQVGGQVWADRYTYWPEMGLWMVVSGMAGAWVSAGRRPVARRRATAAAGLAAAAALGWAARGQVATWADGETLARRALAVTGESDVAERVLGEERYRKGDWAGALEHWEKAAELNGKSGEIWSQVGMARHAAGDRAGARKAWKRAVAVSPEEWKAMNNLAWTALEEGRTVEARAWIHRAMAHAEARASAGVLDTEAAIRRAEENEEE
jgi:tetratricopeptide (TPR) repeat protein